MRKYNISLYFPFNFPTAVTMKYTTTSIILLLLHHVVVLVILKGSEGGLPVKYLPGFPGPLPFELETGYISVGEREDVELFYYFVKSSSSSSINPERDPVLLWLTGGPGCSVLCGLVYEIGPLSFVEEYDGGLPKLTLKPYAWTEVANILFLDLPVGSGFSYGKTPNASNSTGMQSCDQAHQFVRKWFDDHPELSTNPFYVGGDSYTGMTVPVIVQMISDGNMMEKKPNINLKGYLIGNGVTFPDEGDYKKKISHYKIPYAHGMGLISDELYKSLKQNCGEKYQTVDPNNVLCLHNLQTFHELVDEVNGPYILEPNCPLYSPIPVHATRFLQDKPYNIISAYKCRTEKHKLAPLWANDPSVQEALHIRKYEAGEHRNMESMPHYDDLPYTHRYWDSTIYHANLSTRGYRSLIYSGDHDMVVTFLSTQAWIRSLNYPIIDEWRQWLVQGQIAGYTRTYANKMTFATVKGAGHTAPEYKPMECAAMFKRWILNQPL